MISDRQRIAFFKMVGAAWTVSGFGVDREAWRRKEMVEAVGIDSFRLVKFQETYEELMLHFARLAQDMRSVSYYAEATERRLRFVMRAVEADLEFLRGHGHGDAYMVGIYRQAGFDGWRAIDDIPAEHLRLVVQIADSYVRKLRAGAGLKPRDLPSAGAPWHIRGLRRDRPPSRQDSHVSRPEAEAMPMP